MKFKANSVYFSSKPLKIRPSLTHVKEGRIFKGFDEKSKLEM